MKLSLTAAIPWLIRPLVRKNAIEAELDAWTREHGYLPYFENKKKYRLCDWGVRDFKGGCNVVTWVQPNNREIKLPKWFNGAGFENAGTDAD